MKSSLLKHWLWLLLVIGAVGLLSHCAPVSPSKENPQEPSSSDGGNKDQEPSSSDGGNKEVQPDTPIAWKTPFDKPNDHTLTRRVRMSRLY